MLLAIWFRWHFCASYALFIEQGFRGSSLMDFRNHQVDRPRAFCPQFYGSSDVVYGLCHGQDVATVIFAVVCGWFRMGWPPRSHYAPGGSQRTRGGTTVVVFPVAAVPAKSSIDWHAAPSMPSFAPLVVLLPLQMTILQLL